jgi:hypothetical protein
MALDRSGVTIAVVDMLKADSVLYGASGLVQKIESKSVEFSNARADAKRNRTVLYMWSSPEETSDVRMQNSDENYTINMRFETLNIDYEAGVRNIDDAYERVKILTNDQMFNGQMLTAYYTDSTAQIFNIEPTVSSLPEPLVEEDRPGVIVSEVESAIIVQVNRWRN